jgi:hypothetical protein
MTRSLFSIVTASALIAGAGLASAQTTTTTTTQWKPDQRTTITQYSTTQHYKSFSEPNFRPSVGMELPAAATIYPLPGAMKVPSADRYSYGIINDQHVVVERTTRKVVHTW